MVSQQDIDYLLLVAVSHVLFNEPVDTNKCMCYWACKVSFATSKNVGVSWGCASVMNTNHISVVGPDISKENDYLFCGIKVVEGWLKVLVSYIFLQIQP